MSLTIYPWFHHSEFLYPLSLGRWGHLFLVKLGVARAPKKFRTLEQRIIVVPDRVYIHPMPQLLDNLGYLIVSVRGDGPLLAMLVDCGDAAACNLLMDKIRMQHYNNREMKLAAVLCTHKHHDHTAGNQAMSQKDKDMKIYGSVAERVPYCTDYVANGDLVELPVLGDHDLSACIEIEVISVPGHTRGSVAYSLRTHLSAFLFTGDTMFSGGGGVPFEADQEAKRDGKSAGGYIRASAGSNSIERCFAELALRAFPSETITDPTKVLVFPGHEYTHELLNRQFSPGVYDWNKSTPATFFRTASQFYVTSHRKSIPQGRILAVPSLLSFEIDINPNYRMLRKRCDDTVRAIQLWYRLFAHSVIPNEGEGFVTSIVKKNNANPKRLATVESSEDVWNVTADDLTKPTFTAVYTADLDQLIHELDGGKMRPQQAMERLRQMRARPEQPVVKRRPIPGTLPSDKTMYNALLALAVIGCPPTAMTLKDSRLMNLPRPVSPANTHKIKVSKSRVVAMMKFFGLIQDDVEGRDLTTMIDYLWRESADYGIADKEKTDMSDEELAGDIMELGVLRWMLFGIEANQPAWFDRFCMPCGSKPTPKRKQEHPIKGAKLRRTNGELVKHDALTCLLCRDVTGCPLSDDIVEREEEVVENGFAARPANRIKAQLGEEGGQKPIGLPFPNLRPLMRKTSSTPFDERDDSVEVQVVAGSNSWSAY